MFWAIDVMNVLNGVTQQRDRECNIVYGQKYRIAKRLTES